MDALTLHRKATLRRLIAGKPYEGNQAKLATQAGITKSRITQLLDPSDSFGERAAQALCDKLNLPDRFFEDGFDESTAGGTRPVGRLPYSVNRARDVFVVGRGNGGLMPESIWTDGDFPVGATDECAEIATNDEQAFLVRVEGPSMVPRYNPGEFALVEPGTAPELEDDVLVRLVSGQTMIKRLLSRRDGYLLGSYNVTETQHFTEDEVSWVYYIAHPVPRRKIKSRC